MCMALYGHVARKGLYTLSMPNQGKGFFPLKENLPPIINIICIFARTIFINMELFQIGQIIKQELRRQGRTNAWLAEQIHVNPRTINKIFLKNVIDTHQLLIISKALNYDFFSLYSNLLHD